MKSKLHGLMFIALLLSTQLLHAQGSKNLERHLNNAVQSLINNNAYEYRILYPTFHQYNDLMEELGLGTDYWAEEYQNPSIRVQLQNERSRELDRDVARNFTDMRNSLSPRSWNSLEFVDYIVNHKNIDRVTKNVRNFDGLILAYDYFKQEYVMFRFKNVIYFQNRFQGLDLDKLSPEFTVYKSEFKDIANDYFKGDLDL